MPDATATRPLRSMFLAVADLIRDDRYFDMTCDEFVAEAMKATGGSACPELLRDAYIRLVAETQPAATLVEVPDRLN